MKGKTFLFSVCILTILISISFVSAATTFSTSPNTITFTPSDNSEGFTITNTNTSTSLSVTLSLPTVNGVSFQYSGATSNINSSVITVTPTSAIDFSGMDFGESHSGTLTITDASNSSETSTVTVKIENNRLCEYSNPGDLKINIDEMNNDGLGDDDKWYSVDEIEITLDIENDGDEDIDNIEIEWGLYDGSSDKWIIDLKEEDEFDLGDGKDETITFTIDLMDDLDIDLDDLDEGDYTLYVRATGEVDDTEDKTCRSDSESIEIIVEDDYVILDDIKIMGTPFCGSTVQLTAEVFNIGSDDQDDVYIMIYSTELGISEKVVVGDIDAYEDKNLVYEFEIPSDVDEKNYHLTLEVYDEDDDIYENSEDDESKFQIALDVSGNCEKVPEATVYASLESGGKAGQDLEIKATVTNTGSQRKTFTIEVADYSEWAELVDISPSSVTLDADESKDVIITLNVDRDASEDETFSILLESDGDSSTQPVAVTIEKGFSLSGLFGDKGYIWGIAVLNVILIIIIIIVAVRVARR